MVLPFSMAEIVDCGTSTSRANLLWLSSASSRAFFKLFTLCRLLHATCNCQPDTCVILHALLSLYIVDTCAVVSGSVLVVRTNEVVRRRVAILLSERGIMKHRFAQAAKRTASWVPMFLRGERPFPFDRIDEVAAFFQHTPEALIVSLTDEEVKRSSELLKQFRRRSQPRIKRAVAS